MVEVALATTVELLDFRPLKQQNRLQYPMGRVDFDGVTIPLLLSGLLQQRRSSGDICCELEPQGTHHPPTSTQGETQRSKTVAHSSGSHALLSPRSVGIPEGRRSPQTEADPRILTQHTQQ